MPVQTRSKTRSTTPETVQTVETKKPTHVETKKPKHVETKKATQVKSEIDKTNTFEFCEVFVGNEKVNFYDLFKATLLKLDNKKGMGIADTGITTQYVLVMRHEITQLRGVKDIHIINSYIRMLMEINGSPKTITCGSSVIICYELFRIFQYCLDKLNNILAPVFCLSILNKCYTMETQLIGLPFAEDMRPFVADYKALLQNVRIRINDKLNSMLLEYKTMKKDKTDETAKDKLAAAHTVANMNAAGGRL